MKKFFENSHFDIFLTEGGKEILTILREIKVLSKMQAAPKIAMNLRVSEEVHKAIKVLNEIDQGKSNAKL